MDTSKLNLSTSDGRPKPFSFRPPKFNRLIIAITKFVLPMVLRSKLKVDEIEISDGDIQKLKALKKERCLLLPSHSGGFEPFIIVHLSKILKDYYYYLAAIEAFEESPITGWLMQRMGAYSIIRGAADRASFQMTRKILVEGNRWLVIFPEGQTVWQNDTVIPFQQGVIQLAFKAAEKTDKEESLFCVPISIKYVYTKDMKEEIHASMKRLEENLFSDNNPAPQDTLDRLHRISEAVLSANEKKYNVKPEENADLESRIQHMKEKIVSRIEQQIQIKPRDDQSLLDRIRTLFNTVDRIVHEESDGSEYEHKLLREQQHSARELYNDLWRVLQFIAIYGGYVREAMTAERFLDALCLLEMEVFGKRRMWGPRKACIKIGEPVNLNTLLPEYKANKQKVILDTTLSLESSVRKMLKELSSSQKIR